MRYYVYLRQGLSSSADGHKRVVHSVAGTEVLVLRIKKQAALLSLIRREPIVINRITDRRVDEVFSYVGFVSRRTRGARKLYNARLLTVVEQARELANQLNRREGYVIHQ